MVYILRSAISYLLNIVSLFSLLPAPVVCCCSQTAKNLILAGINVTILDSAELVEEDLNSIFYAQLEEVGQMVR